MNKLPEMNLFYVKTKTTLKADFNVSRKWNEVKCVYNRR